MDSVFTYPDHFKEDFRPLYEAINKNRLVGSDLEANRSTCDNFKFPSRYVRAVLSSDEVKLIEEICLKLNIADSISDVTVNSIFLNFSSINIKGKEFRSSGKQTNNAVVIWRPSH